MTTCLLIATLAAVIHLRTPTAKTPPSSGIEPADAEQFITWERTPGCIGRAICEARALEAYALGKRLVEDSRADITNPYHAYLQFERAHQLVEQGNPLVEPEWLSDAREQRDTLKAQLDQVFRASRVRFHIALDHHDYRRAARELERIHALFPDPRCAYYKWATRQKQQMVARGKIRRLVS
jgi:hypothetical protein